MRAFRDLAELYGNVRLSWVVLIMLTILLWIGVIETIDYVVHLFGG